MRQCVLPHGLPTAAAGLLRELVRFGVEELILPEGGPPCPPLPRPLRFVALPAKEDFVAAAATWLQDRVLICDPDARLDFNLAHLLSRPGSSAAFHGLTDSGVRVLRQGDTGPPPPVPVTPLPGHAVRPALFLDRDGTINVDHGYVGTRERFEWCPGALDAIRIATDAGWHVFVVTNQSGIARGLYDEAALAALHGWMVDEIRRAGGNVDDLRFCPFHEAATIPRYRQASAWRKPAPGMILDLIEHWSLDPSRCLLMGDQASDMQAAAAAGIAGRLVGDATLPDIVGEAIRVPFSPSS